MDRRDSDQSSAAIDDLEKQAITTAHYADDATPRGLARACLTLIDDDAARLACGREANALADERFSWACEREKYAAAYVRLSRAYAVAPTLAKS